MSADFKPFIIVVDDAPELIELIEGTLANVGYPTKGFTSPVEALDFIRENRNRLVMVFSDFKMPKMNGMDLRKKMLEEGIDCPFVIISAHVTRTMLAEGIEQKISKFIGKPYDDEDIQEAYVAEGQARAALLEEKAFLRSTFTVESVELFESLESLILELEGNPSNLDLINNIFRSVHTIKGASSVIDWPFFTKFCHIYEDLLSRLKNGAIVVTDDVISNLLKGADYLGTLIKSIQNETQVDIDLEYWEKFFHFEPTKKVVKELKKAAQPTVSQKDVETIRVTTAILDEVMEQSGEITVIRNTINKLVKTLSILLEGNSEVKNLADMLEELHKVIAAMQNRILELRLVPVKTIYRVLPRTIRDLCSSLGKKVELKLIGQELAVDTKLAQVLSNSLVHIVRNCCDHGIEMPEKRVAAGKPETGTIVIDSSETGEEVVIVIKDDGGGIDTERVRSIAVEKGLYSRSEVDKMSERRVFNLIFEPGFSTAKVVTDVSGRGVGMDMVKSSVIECGGRIEISSDFGSGSTFTMRLPIPRSVLIIHSLSVRVGNQQFSIPQDTIERLIQLDDRRRHLIKEMEGADILDLDGELIQIVPLAFALGLASNIRMAKYLGDNNDTACFVITKSEHGVFALYVDEILDNEEIVVKSLGNEVGGLGIYSGATFLGDGSIGLILDMDGIASKANLVYLDDETEEESSRENLYETGVKSDYLVLEVEGNNHRRLCIELSEVFRLEEFSRKEINIVDGLKTAIYRNQVIPLIDLANEIGVYSHSNVSSIEALMAVIVLRHGRYSAIIIKRINELKSTYSPLDCTIGIESCYIGTTVLEGKVYSVINPGYMIEKYQDYNQQLSEEGSVQVEETEQKKVVLKTMQQEVSDSQDEVEGLHLF